MKITVLPSCLFFYQCQEIWKNSRTESADMTPSCIDAGESGSGPSAARKRGR